MESVICIMSWLADFGTFAAGASTVALAVAAWVGLTSWKKQEKIKAKIKFLDDLADVAYEYVIGISPLVTVLQSVETGIQAHSEAEALQGNMGEFAGFRKFLERDDNFNASRMEAYIEKVRPIKVRLSSLAIKGQVLGFQGYQDCQDASQILLALSGQIEALSVVMKSRNWNFEHPEIQETIRNALENVTSTNIDTNLNASYANLHDFVERQYKKALG